MIPLNQFKSRWPITIGDVVYVVDPELVTRSHPNVDVTFEVGTPVVYEMPVPGYTIDEDGFVVVSRPDSRFYYTVSKAAVGVIGGE